MDTKTLLSSLATEQVNARSERLDQMSALEIVTLMNDVTADVTAGVSRALPALAEAFRGAERGFPYDGAKEHYILDMDDRALLDEVVPLLETHMPLPKPRKKKS